MTKVYVIIHDDKYVLVGKGPNSRQGYHLPGGTLDESKNKKETEKECVIRETKEETGLTIAEEKLANRFHVPPNEDVVFFTLKVKSVDECIGSAGAKKGTSQDPPFEVLMKVAINTASSEPNLMIKDVTDYFGPAIGLARQKGYLS